MALALGGGSPRPRHKRVVVGEQTFDLVVERLRFGEVHQPDRAAGHLVLVSRPDAALGRADLGSARARRLAVGVQFAVKREDERNVLGDLQVGGRHLDALAADGLDLVDEMVGIEHHAVADHRELARADDAGGKQRELEHLAVDHQRMAGVMAALETNDDVGGERQPVDDLALPFVAPLGADNNDIGHRGSLSLVPQTQNPDASDNKLEPGLIAEIA